MAEGIGSNDIRSSMQEFKVGKSIKKLWQHRFDHQNYNIYNELTQFLPSSVFMHGATWDNSPSVRVT